MRDTKSVDLVRTVHTATYGTEPSCVSYAPGRIEVLGNHTDYNSGTTLSAAINMGTAFTIAPSGQSGVRLHAGKFHVTTEFDPTTNERLDGTVQWANYVKGVFFHLHERGISVDGVDCAFAGSIPLGAGLSSSAALEVAAAYALLEYSGQSLPPVELAMIAQAAEQDFAGCNCGLLDQFSSIFGVDHGLVHSDFRSLETHPVRLPEDAVFLMIDPHIKHELADSPYNARRISCGRAARELGALLDYPVDALRDVSWKAFEAHRDRIDPEAAQRAAHVIAEITRVESSSELLETGDLEAFGQLLFDSHDTSRTAFENSCPELDTIVVAARDAGALGARLSGGGWGGSVVALTRAAEADGIREQIIGICKEKGLDPAAETIIPSAGATVIRPGQT